MAQFKDEYLGSLLVRQRLMLESENTNAVLTGYWAVAVQGDGRQVVMQAGTRSVPDYMQQTFARDMARALNSAIRHDGSWLVLWTHPCFDDGQERVVDFNMWHFLWLDEDGDPQFTIDNEDPFWLALANGELHWLEQAEYAWSQWNLMMREVLAPTEGQTYKRAQGQAPASSDTIN